MSKIRTILLFTILTLVAFKSFGQDCDSLFFPKDIKILGAPVKDTNFCPWQVSILTKTGGFKGAGVLIDRQYVLTAAHVIINREVYVYIGSVCWGKGKRYSGEHIVHEKYGIPDKLDNDIALIKLDQPVDIESFIALPKSENDTLIAGVGTKGFVTGWGFDGANAKVNWIRFGRVTLASNDECDFINGNNKLRCASADKFGSPCSGDSGGPLFTFKNDKPIVLGIISKSLSCTVPDRKHSYYTNIFKYLDWINENCGNCGTTY